MSDLPTGACALPHWAVLRASGPDAAAFLHAQLTQSVTDLPADRVRLGGYCTAKGRLQANFLLRRAADGSGDLLLLLPAALREGLRKRLSMFVLRSKVQLSLDDTPVFGVLGALPSSLPEWGVDGPWLRLPDALGQARALYAGELPATLPPEAWAWADLHAALPWVQAETTEHHVPQMLNQDLVGGVNFQKGCYPGQEVVARSQYRGTVKRRSFLFAASTPAAPGTELFHSADTDQPAGEVLACASWQGQTHLLAEVRLAALEDGELQIAGQLLRPLPMPYTVKAPE